MADNGKCDFVVASLNGSLDNEGRIIDWPNDSGFDFQDHNPLKRGLFHEDLDEVFLEYKADVNRQKAAIFVLRADEYVAQAAELRACGSPEERRVLAKKRGAENILADSMGITVERLREMLAVSVE